MSMDREGVVPSAGALESEWGGDGTGEIGSLFTIFAFRPKLKMLFLFIVFFDAPAPSAVLSSSSASLSGLSTVSVGGAEEIEDEEGEWREDMAAMWTEISSLLLEKVVPLRLERGGGTKHEDTELLLTSGVLGEVLMTGGGRRLGLKVLPWFLPTVAAPTIGDTPTTGGGSKEATAAPDPGFFTGGRGGVGV